YATASTYSSNFSFSGLFKSTDAGETWKNVSRGLSTSSITTLAIDFENPNTIYAGGNGIVKSIDGGATWIDERVNFFPLAMVIDPHNPRTLYASTWDGEIGGPTSLFTSKDAGSTWNPTASGFPATGFWIQSVAVDPYNSSQIFAGTNQGLFRSA